MCDIYTFVENNYSKYYYIIKSTRTLLLNNDILLCYNTIDHIIDIDKYIKSNMCYKFSKLPIIFRNYIVEHLDEYELGIIINNEIDSDYNKNNIIFNFLMKKTN